MTCHVDATSPAPSLVRDFMVRDSKVLGPNQLVLALEWRPPAIENGQLNGSLVCVSPEGLKPDQDPGVGSGVICHGIGVS